jgi:mannose-6-phosphate isomerase-like protein (cupin superfamily)
VKRPLSVLNFELGTLIFVNTAKYKVHKNVDNRLELHIKMEKINLQQKLSLFDDYWNPRIAGELNGQYVKLVKFKGPFTWHHHESEDELFMVVKGRFRMDFREEASGQDEKARTVWLEEGEMIIVPRGIEHCPVAEEECHVLLFEPVSTLNTGNTENELTRKELTKI